jgi:eukaryotic-like serine/threonine-protein kinase
MSWGREQRVNNGRYQILDRIGTGGFGVTYRAIDLKAPSPDNIVAIKTVNEKRQRQANFEQHQENFLNEAVSLAKCRHPHVIRVDRVFQEAGLWAMVMEFVAGESLEDYILGRGCLEEAEAIGIITKVGDAVSYVHVQELLHRDIKPANILIRSNGEPVLIDFGLARGFVAGITGSMTNSQSPHYSPPEQGQRRGDFRPALDIYALAATLYTCITGTPPPMAEIRTIRDSLILPKRLNKKVSDQLSEAVLRGMELLPEDRPQTIEEFLELLEVEIHPTANEPIRGDDLRIDLTLSFQEAAFGVQKEFRIDYLQSCDICNTSEFANLALDKCFQCNGEKRFKEIKRLQISVPCGVDTGTRLRVSREGDAGKNGGDTGDLYIYLLVGEDAELQREDANVFSTIEITTYEATIGCEKIVRTVGSSALVKIPPKTKNGTVLRLRGLGIHRLQNPLSRGDHLLKIIVN